MVVTSAPGKIILLGEHAVVFGQPAIATAISLRLRCRATRSNVYAVNGHPLSDRGHPYIRAALQSGWNGEPLAIETDSDFPSGSGMGSSAAVSVATLTAFHQMQGKIDPLSIAEEAFAVELAVQGRASPIDTSVSTHGQGILVDNKEGPGLLWHICRDTRHWYIHHLDVPQLSLVIGFTGICAPTGPLVAKVKRYADHTRFAKDIIEEVGGLTREGVVALKHNDLVRLGQLMTQDHRLLAILGVSCRELDTLVDACRPLSYGVKLTGAGGGGSMVALTDRPSEVSEQIRRRGATPFIVKTGVEGARVESV
jgi:mevalonate kinase